LARADPSLSILLVEHGKNNLNDPNVVNASRYLYHLAPGTQTAIVYKGNKTDDLNGREPIVTAGGILGGGSSINFAMYTRGMIHPKQSGDLGKHGTMNLTYNAQLRVSITTHGTLKDGTRKASYTMPRSWRHTTSITQMLTRAFMATMVLSTYPSVHTVPRMPRTTSWLAPQLLAFPKS
jgi:choline dehydrogenase-like flavoprotein